jgi:hypothetical protein
MTMGVLAVTTTWATADAGATRAAVARAATTTACRSMGGILC